jgi:hypothetical protein
MEATNEFRLPIVVHSFNPQAVVTNETLFVPFSNRGECENS